MTDCVRETLIAMIAGRKHRGRRSDEHQNNPNRIGGQSLETLKLTGVSMILELVRSDLGQGLVQFSVSRCI